MSRERVVALDPWRVQKDDCRKHVDMSLEGETRTGDCPAGYTGSGVFDLWTDYWTQVVYAAPVPYVADHQLAGTYRRVPGGSTSRCSPPPSTSGGNGGNGGGNDHRSYVDPDTGKRYYRQPTGYDRHNPWKSVDKRPTEVGPPPPVDNKKN